MQAGWGAGVAKGEVVALRRWYEGEAAMGRQVPAFVTLYTSKPGKGPRFFPELPQFMFQRDSELFLKRGTERELSRAVGARVEAIGYIILAAGKGDGAAYPAPFDTVCCMRGQGEDACSHSWSPAKQGAGAIWVWLLHP